MHIFQQISSKTDEIGEKLHTLLYFVSGMRESLFQRHQCDASTMHVAPPQGDVTANVPTKRQGLAKEEGETVGQKDPKQHRNEGPQSSSPNKQN